MVRSLARLWSVDPGFNPQNVLTFGYTLPPSMINGNPDAIRAAYRNFDDRACGDARNGSGLAILGRHADAG